MITQGLPLMDSLSMVRNGKVELDETELLLPIINFLIISPNVLSCNLETFLVTALQIYKTNQDRTTWKINIFQGMHQIMLFLKKQVVLLMKISQMVHTLDSKQCTLTKQNSK